MSDADLLHAKIVEEANELIAATDALETVNEAADVIYFTLVKLRQSGVSLQDVERELKRRTLRITRRAGDAKREVSR